MSAVWAASFAAVRRRRLQTVIIALVVLLSTMTIVVALGLLNASSAPFQHAFDKHAGAHVVATFDQNSVTGSQLTQAARQPGVEAVAGPFSQSVLTLGPSAHFDTGALTVVGRPSAGAPVDPLSLTAGRWATAPGEIVINDRSVRGPDDDALGATLSTHTSAPLRVVGVAVSVSGSGDAWVSPDQMQRLHPSAQQMLYRFRDAASSAQITSDVATVTSTLPPHSLLAWRSYLVTKQAFAAGPASLVPFLVVFGVLGFVVAILIVANVVSGAVISGFRYIGILKALGFTPGQVVVIHLVMVSVPAVAGCLVGTLLGDFAATRLLASAFQGATFNLGSVGLALGHVGVPLWVLVAALVGMPAVVLAAALVPALRAHGLSAAEAITAGSAPRSGRALRIQRWIGGTRLPRSVSLGIGLPFARPGRTALTMMSILLGVITVTFASGLSASVTKYGKAVDLAGAIQVTVAPGDFTHGQVVPKHNDAQIESLLRSLPGTRHVTTDQHVDLSLVGYTQGTVVDFLRGDSSTLGFQNELVTGHWMHGPGQIVAASQFLHEHGLRVGDRLTLSAGSKQVPTTIVGEIIAGAPASLYTDWQSLAGLAPDYLSLDHWMQYQIGLTPETNIAAYIKTVRSADPGLYGADSSSSTDPFTVAVLSLSVILTLLLGTVAALGVFNTVVLNTRERRRDLGMLKSIGMTPRQVIVMMVTSMAGLGFIGGVIGVPLGILAHHVVVPLATKAATVDTPASIMHVWNAPRLVLLVIAGIAIAVLGAFIPARSAARLTIAKVLHSE